MSRIYVKASLYPRFKLQMDSDRQTEYASVVNEGSPVPGPVLGSPTHVPLLLYNAKSRATSSVADRARRWEAQMLDSGDIGQARRSTRPSSSSSMDSPVTIGPDIPPIDAQSM